MIVIPEPFEYHVTHSLQEASRLVAQFGTEGKILAGGHSLVPLMKFRLAAPKYLVDISRLGDLKYIREDGEKIEIGALATHYQVESSELLKAKCPLLPETAAEIGDVQVRNKGTLGGSISHADPAGDWPAAIVALDTEIKAVSARGERWIAAKDFFVELLTTALEGDEILTAVRVPVLGARTGSAYLKFRHPASGYATVGVAAVVSLEEQGHIAKASVGVTGVGPKAYRATAVEEALQGKPASAKRLGEASAHATEGIEVNSDLYASAEYRSHLATVYTRRALERAIERAGHPA
jgi:aerobic carbon-monoxide dehydrogenase medium subunit